jgi:TetR/AcrR family transcriptional repressor of nem operon
MTNQNNNDSMPRVKLFNEEEVLQKTINLFWEKGYNNTSIQDLVNHLGINRGSLYDTFGGKRELFDLAFKKYLKTNNDGLIAFFDKQKLVKKGFLNFYEIPLNAAVCDKGIRGCFAVNTITEMLPEDTVMKELLTKNKAIIESAFLSFLQKGVVSGEISESKNLKKITSLLYSLLNGLLVTAKIDFNKKELLETVKTGLLVLD